MRRLFTAALAAALAFASSPGSAVTPLELLRRTPRPAAGAPTSTPATFVASNGVQVSSSTSFNCAMPAGAQANDIVIAWFAVGFSSGDTATMTGSGSAMDQLDYDFGSGISFSFYSVFARKLTSAEAGNGNITITGVSTGSGCYTALYRNAGGVVFRSRQNGTSTSILNTGYTPVASSKGAIEVALNGDETDSTISGSPGTWAVGMDRFTSSAGAKRAYAMDQLDGTYSGSNVTMANLNAAGGTEKVVWLLELTP